METKIVEEIKVYFSKEEEEKAIKILAMNVLRNLNESNQLPDENMRIIENKFKEELELLG